MAVEVTRSTEVVLPVSVEDAWAVLSDTPRMVALDPLLDRYKPERGTIEEGTLNRVRARLGPLRTTMTARTELLEPPRRAVFVSVSPSRPVRVRTEDVLEAVEGGCSYRVTVTVTPTVPLVGRPAVWVMVRTMAADRRRFQARLRTEIATSD
jgi:carbon monoxide dehydrogenase subunit G